MGAHSNNTKFHINEEWLRKRYSYERATVKELADEVGCSTHNIKKWLAIWKIRRVNEIKFVPWNKGLTKESDNRLAKISNDRKGEGNPMHGKPTWNKGLSLEDERVEKMAACHRGRPLTDEHKEKLRQAKLGMTRERAGHWKGGKPRLMTNGYVVAERKYVHRRIAEERLGRKLTRRDNVHHIDSDKTNNKPENLLVITNRAHTNLHRVMREGVITNAPYAQKLWLLFNGYWYEELTDENS